MEVMGVLGVMEAEEVMEERKIFFCVITENRNSGGRGGNGDEKKAPGNGGNGGSGGRGFVYPIFVILISKSAVIVVQEEMEEMVVSKFQL